MTLTDEELDALERKYGDRAVLTRPPDQGPVSVCDACEQAKEANRLRGELQMALLKPTAPPFGGNVERAYEAYAEMRKERDAFAKLNVTLRAALGEMDRLCHKNMRMLVDWSEADAEQLEELRKLTETK